MSMLEQIEAQPRRHWRGWFLPVGAVWVLCASGCWTDLSAAESAGAAAKPTVNVVQAPAKCLVPDVVVDAKGVLHMVYGLEHHAYYVRSTNNGGTFTPPVKVNSTGLVETKMGERGPKLAVGNDGVVHVVWMDEWAPGVKTFVRYSRSLDKGKSFEALKSLSSMSGIDGVTVTADGQGNVVAFWHVMADPKPEVKAATWLHTARSTDNGATFQADESRPERQAWWASRLPGQRPRRSSEPTTTITSSPPPVKRAHPDAPTTAVVSARHDSHFLSRSRSRLRAR